MALYVYSQAEREHAKHNSRDSNQILLNDRHQPVLIMNNELHIAGEVCYLRLLCYGSTAFSIVDQFYDYFKTDWQYFTLMQLQAVGTSSIE